MICGLCLKEIHPDSEHVKVVLKNGTESYRHKECSDKLDDYVLKLKDIYDMEKPE